MDVVYDDAKAGFRRIEVLTDPPRRRRWSEEEKARIVAATLRAGATVMEVGRRWEVCPQQVCGWRRQAREGQLALSGHEQALTRIRRARRPRGNPRSGRRRRLASRSGSPVRWCGWRPTRTARGHLRELGRGGGTDLKSGRGAARVICPRR
jgi:transposase-like protein